MVEMMLSRDCIMNFGNPETKLVVLEIQSQLKI